LFQSVDWKSLNPETALLNRRKVFCGTEKKGIMAYSAAVLREPVITMHFN